MSCCKRLGQCTTFKEGERVYWDVRGDLFILVLVTQVYTVGTNALGCASTTRVHTTSTQSVIKSSWSTSDQVIYS